MIVGGFSADWPAPPGVRSWQTTRAGGVSSGSYASLNLGLHVGDRPECVAANRDRLATQLDLPQAPHWLDQVHGTRILDLDRGDRGSADGAVTRAAGVVLAVMTADCLPVLLATADGSAIGVAHAGWRGLADGVLEQAVAALADDPAQIVAWLGPAIAQDSFEVGDEVRAALLARDPGAADASATAVVGPAMADPGVPDLVAADPAAFRANSRGRWQADLHGLARRALERAGVGSIHGRPDCTFSHPDRYFSHRREAPCGRMVTLIWREPRR